MGRGRSYGNVLLGAAERDRRIWFKRFRLLHGVITESLQDCLDSGSVPDWMVENSQEVQKISC